MSNQYIYNSYQQYSPNVGHNSLAALPNANTSPTSNLAYMSPPCSGSSSLSGSLSSSASSSTSSSGLGAPSSLPASNYSFHNPRFRYYLSKSFDVEDDLEFCPDIPDSLNTSPTTKKFNPYTASVFSPSQELNGTSSMSSNSSSNASSSPRVHTPRIKKPLEIINPQTKMRVGSPATK